MKYTEKMSQRLNQLLEKNYDAEKGYKKAADLTDNPKLKQFYENQAQQRYQYGHDLKSEIANFGETPDKGTSIKGDAHRTWMTIKSTFTSQDEEAILQEVQTGEEAAVEEYNDIINDTTLPPSTQNILSKQRTGIQAALQSAKNFETVVS